VLAELQIENFAIIDRLDLSLQGGLNVITGETGAGKSIVIGAIQLLLGAKGSSELIRESKEEAEVEGLFDISKSNVQDRLVNAGFGRYDKVLLKRIILRSGRSKAYINGRLATIPLLSEIGKELVNIYGQHEHQLLLYPEKHIDLLDGFGELQRQRKAVSDLYQEWKRLIFEQKRLRSELNTIEQQKELWDFQLREIEAANLKEAEDEDLSKELQILTNAEKLKEHASGIEEGLYTGTYSAYETLGQVRHRLKEIGKIDASVADQEELLQTILIQIDELVRFTREYQKGILSDPNRLVEVEQRILEIRRLKRKYGNTIDEINTLKRHLEEQLARSSNTDERIRVLQHDLDKTGASIAEEALTLSTERKDVALRLSGLIERELRDLGMNRPIFQVRVDELTDRKENGFPRVDGSPIGPNGIDRVEFFISTNEGESPRPLSKIASGGELSRIMLAMKKTFARAVGIPTLIFDEIDAGIGGGVAQIVGEKLRSISEDHQVFCITHLPQIACYANAHFKVTKEAKGQRTITSVRVLSENERVDEIARMLGGLEVTEKTREHAQEMISQVKG
jgi:DNA repair protein RecN (Recombination protein N)